MHQIVKAIPECEFVLRVWFSTGESGLFDARTFLTGPIYEPLTDPEYFRKVEVDPVAGTVCWPNGADFCPDVIYEALCGISSSS